MTEVLYQKIKLREVNMLIKQLIFENYFMEPASFRFKAFAGNKRIKEIFNYMINEISIKKMIICSVEERPALEGIIENLELMYPFDESFDLFSNMKHRQILGSMTRYIMGHYDYRPGKAKKMKKGRYIKTAIVYHKVDLC